MATETTDPNPYNLGHYEGLIFQTARRYERYVEMEFDDFAQTLRIKVWQALEKYDPRRSTMTVRAYVFQCMTNQVKDVLKKKVRNEYHIEEAQSWEDDGPGGDSTKLAAKFLSISEEQAFVEVDEGDEPELPDFFTEDERRVALLLIDDYTQPEIATALGIRLGQVRALVAAIRLKMGGQGGPLRRVEAPELALAA